MSAIAVPSESLVKDVTAVLASVFPVETLDVGQEKTRRVLGAMKGPALSSIACDVVAAFLLQLTPIPPLPGRGLLVHEANPVVFVLTVGEAAALVANALFARQVLRTEFVPEEGR